MMIRSDRRRTGEITAVLGGAALLAGSWIVAATQDHVLDREAQIFRSINGLPQWIWPFAWLPMQAGSLIGSLVIAAVSFGFNPNPCVGLATLLAGQGAFWSAKLVKHIVLRERPVALLAEVQLREDARGLGYVSGHAAVTFGAAAALAPSLKRQWLPVAMGLPVIVGFARVYSGAHLPLDVIGGAGMGLLTGTLARWTLGLGGEGLPALD
jgi:undecaprenyl-diphosphatase